MKESPKADINAFHYNSRKSFPDETRLTQEMIDCWWKKRDTEDKAANMTRVCAVVPFLKFVQQRHPECGIVIPKIPVCKYPEYIPHAFTDDELRRFFHACDNMKRHDNRMEFRLNEVEIPIVFRLLLSTGMRTTEVYLLKTKNVNLDKGVIYIEKDATKGYRERIVPVHDSMLEALRIYDKAAGRLIPDRTAFFPNKNGQAHSNRWVSDHFHRNWAAAGNVKGVRAYDLRHHFIISTINSWTHKDYSINSDLVALSKYVGHASVQSTYAYYAFTPRLGDEIEQMSQSRMGKVQKITYMPYEEEK